MTQKIMSQCYGAHFTASPIHCNMTPFMKRASSHSLRELAARRAYVSSSPKITQSGERLENTTNVTCVANNPIGKRAKQKQTDREFFTDLLSAAATKRDSKAYISRLKSPARTTSTPAKNETTKSRVNLGTLFSKSRAVEASPRFRQHDEEESRVEEQETIHVALVKIRDVGTMSDTHVKGIAQTLTQLSRLSMAPCVVVEVSSASEDTQLKRELWRHAERLAEAIDAVNDTGARIIENILVETHNGPEILLNKLLLRPMRRGMIPIVVPVAYSEQHQKAVPVAAAQAVLALTKAFSREKQLHMNDKSQKSLIQQSLQPQTSLDRIIVIDEAGGIPSSSSTDGKHVFINLAQEYIPLMNELSKSQSRASFQHMSNLELLRRALDILPQASSGLMTTPDEAANILPRQESSTASMVGTRRQKNTLIHNLLTDKPAYSASLPKARLTKNSGSTVPVSVSTFIKQGMPVTVLPNPASHPWTSTSARIKLTDHLIDLRKLVYLIDDSFNRSLDVEAYLERVNDRLAGVIIAGDYEGGAILTWETPAGVDPSDTSRLVPYLDKFAVLKRSQGAGGVADIVFNAMVRTCLPDGVCWRSRKNNPVNKWYFERSTGTWKIPDMNWTMFWTTPSVATDSQAFRDYEAVCRGVIPTWVEKGVAAD